MDRMMHRHTSIIRMLPHRATMAVGLIFCLAGSIFVSVVQAGNPRGPLIEGEPVPERIEFRRHILPVLSKRGCNGGACHGAQAGKGGFRLSLNGYDPAGDYFNLTRQSRGRRIELAQPSRSLMLTKPTGAVAHKGGLRLDPDSDDYRLLVEWIARGAPGPREDDCRLERIEVEPKQLSLAPDTSRPLKVWAYYSDGTRDDVTRWSRFNSTHEPVARVDPTGTTTVVDSGEAAIVVWFSSRLVTARVLSPFANDLAPDTWENAPQRNFIDGLVLNKLRQLNLAPSPRCDDATFIRRIYLDTVGVLPTVDEVNAFLSDSRPDKRDRLIERVLNREEFVDYWTHKWSDLFLINGRRLRPPAVQAYYGWLREQVASNRPWDEIVRDVVTAQGSSLENGETNFYALHQTPEDMAENVSQAFLGLSINCAKCHNHPLEKWTNDQYYAMANLFSRVRAKGWGGDGRNGDGRRTLFLASSGELIQPLTGQPQPPAPLDGQPLAFDDPSDRRVHLAEWLTAPENPYFSRSIANRVWANFLGRGLVEAVDDMRISNPATNEPLLQALAAELVDNGYDLKHLMVQILQSETYQRSSQAIPANRPDDRFYARYYPRRLKAEVLLDAISQVTEVPTPFTEIAFKGADKQKTDKYPLGTRALELADSAVASRFLTQFGRNPRDIVCECERSDQPSMVQVLHLANGDTINEKLKADSSCVAAWFDESSAGEFQPQVIIRQAYLTALSRPPSDREIRELTQVLQEVATDQRRAAVEDLYWSLLSSREFLFQH